MISKWSVAPGGISNTLLPLSTALCLVLLSGTRTWAEPDEPGVQASVSTSTLTADQLFSIRAPADQPREGPFVLRLLDDLELARRVLERGVFLRHGKGQWVRALTRKKSREPAVMFRMRLRLSGYPPVEVFFKPRQRGYADWATETAVCRLARYLGVVVAPCSERVVSRSVLAPALARLPAAYRRRIIWDRTSCKGRLDANCEQVYGFFRVWAPNYTDRLGPYRSTERLLRSLASTIAVGNRRRVAKSRLHRELGDLFVLDYLIYNNDRRRNLGTVRGGELRLFPIDFGDGFTATPRGKVLCRRLFYRLTLFRRRLIQRLRTLTRKRARALFARRAGPPLVSRSQLDWMMGQRRKILAHVGWVRYRFGKKALY